ncbi:MAG: hypothetical protein KDA87_13380 [Planctomycetales bacterium]|nr:hypothetical protein [Planctomycetales bacterium]
MNQKTIVLSLDGLGAGFLGPYGNTWIETPAWNRLASQSVLFENAFAHSADVSSFQNACWSNDKDGSSPNLWQRVAAELETVLVSDALNFQDHVPTGVDVTRQVDYPDEMRLADSIESSRFAAYFARLLESIEERSGNYFLWAQCDLLTTCWDAPLEFRQQWSDEGDAIPPDCVVPPSIKFADLDPDEQHAYACAYAGQITVLDYCLEAFLDTLPNDVTLLVMGNRGFPLGEHGVIGFDSAVPLTNLSHVPLLLRLADHPLRGQRAPGFWHPAALDEFLTPWCEAHAMDQVIKKWLLRPATENWAMTTASAATAIRTEYWLMLQRAGGDVSLFVKPDDRWDANDVADRCPQVVQAFHAFHHQILADSNSATPTRPIVPDLLARSFE